MTSSNQYNDCTRKCWIGSAIAGGVLAILLLAFGGWSFIQAVFAGLIGFVILGFLLSKFMCAQASGTESKSVASAGAGAAVAVGAAGTAVASNASKASSASAADATTASKAFDVQPTAALAGQDTLAEKQKGGTVAKPAAKKASAKKSAAKKPAATKVVAKSAGTKTASSKATTAKPSAAKPKTPTATATKASTAMPATKAAAKPAAAKTATKPAKPAAKKAPAPAKTAKANAPAKAPKAAAPAKAKRAPVAADGKPALMTKARAGGADDLKLISGVGPKLEGTLNEMGFWHFDQVAGWRKKEIEWVDSRLKFKGRIERDEWISQAKILAKGGETAFSKKKST